MTFEVNTSNELDAINTKLKDMITSVTELSGVIDTVKFLTVKDVAELTGWNVTTVRNLFNIEDFPSCDYGREKVVEIHALVAYFSVPRRREVK